MSPYIAGMCGRFTKNYTWAQIHAMYSARGDPNFQPNFNVCPIDAADTIVPNEGGRELVTMR